MGAVVETMGCVRDGYLEPIAYGALPGELAELVAPHCIVQKMTIDALAEGNRQMLLEALEQDPVSAVLKPDQLRAMAQELLEANRDYLPESMK